MDSLSVRETLIWSHSYLSKADRGDFGHSLKPQMYSLSRWTLMWTVSRPLAFPSMRWKHRFYVLYCIFCYSSTYVVITIQRSHFFDFWQYVNLILQKSPLLTNILPKVFLVLIKVIHNTFYQLLYFIAVRSFTWKSHWRLLSPSTLSHSTFHMHSDPS